MKHESKKLRDQQVEPRIRGKPRRFRSVGSGQ